MDFDRKQLAIIALAAADIVASYPDAAVGILRRYATALGELEDLDQVDAGDEAPLE